VRMGTLVPFGSEVPGPVFADELLAALRIAAGGRTAISAPPHLSSRWLVAGVVAASGIVAGIVHHQRRSA
jgi:hypothetical protein